MSSSVYGESLVNFVLKNEQGNVVTVRCIC